jgi:hypothetical protein
MTAGGILEMVAGLAVGRISAILLSRANPSTRISWWANSPKRPRMANMLRAVDFKGSVRARSGPWAGARSAGRARGAREPSRARCSVRN